jgi:light-regulated signal transduction histidine kinase (bacteriophytochrome)
MDAVIHRTKAGLILEMERSIEVPELDIAGMLGRTLTAVHFAPSLVEACNEAVRGLRAITGFDRTMIYRFRNDGSGAVIAEDRREDLVAFLGLHFPASDIPQPARQLFVINPLRVWTTTEAGSASIVPLPGQTAGTPLDMTRCVLRAASPIHLEYLRNMGVGASMALSIVREDRLWGMIVCHHESTHYVPHPQRVVLQSLGHLLALQIATKERHEEAAEIARLNDWTVHALGSIHVTGDLFSSLQMLGPRLLEFVRASGAAVHVGGGIFVIGKTPSTATIAALARAVAAQGVADILATSVLQERFPGLPGLKEAGACGMLALPVSRDSEDLVMWFRPEITQSVTWAGDPARPFTNDPTADRVMPRASFEAWVDTARDRSEDWTDIEIDATRAFGRALLESAPRRRSEQEASWLATQARQALLLNEFAQTLTNALPGARMAAEQTQQLVEALERLAAGLRQT